MFLWVGPWDVSSLWQGASEIPTHQNGEHVFLSLLTPFLQFSQKQQLLSSAIDVFWSLLLVLQLGHRDLPFFFPLKKKSHSIFKLFTNLCVLVWLGQSRAAFILHPYLLYVRQSV